MVNHETYPARELMRLSDVRQLEPQRIDGPASNELERAAKLSDELHHQIQRAKHLGLEQVRFGVESSEELLQLLKDSLRTAEQIKGINQ